MSDTPELPFNWPMCSQPKTFCPIRKCWFSSIRLDARWSLLCFWSIDGIKPVSLAIQRKSTTGNAMVSGLFKLVRNGVCVLQLKIVQLIESGSRDIAIDLEQAIENNLFFAGGFTFPQMAPEFSISGTFSVTPKMVHEQVKKDIPANSLLKLSNDFRRLLDPETTYFEDVVLNCAGASFSVHKNILAVRSPVFAAMFTANMKEKFKNEVEITDISPLVLKEMLVYIYTGKTEELSVTSAGELLFAADKYELQDLKRVCVEYLKSCMSVENVLDVLVLGYLHYSELEDFCVDFMSNRCEEFEVIENTEKWKQLCESQPSLTMEVYRRVVKSKDKKLKRFK